MTSRLLELHAAVQRVPGPGGQAGSPPAGAPFHAGDVASLAVHATVEGDGQVKWPSREELQEILGQQAAVLGEGAPVAADDALGLGRPEARAWPIQILLAPGEGSIGPIPLTLVDAAGREADKAEVPAATVVVETVLEPELAHRLDAAQPAPELKAEMTKQLSAPRGPWAVQSRWPLGLMALGAAILIALAFLAWRLRRRTRPAPPAPPLEAAEVVARRRLAGLAASGFLGRGEHLAFHVELADILKQYLSRRLGTDLMELTTEEVRRTLRGEMRSEAARALGASVRAGEVRSEIFRVLTACDVVKFARHVPPPASSLDLHGAVARIVDLTTTALTAMDGAASTVVPPVAPAGPPSAVPARTQGAAPEPR